MKNLVTLFILLSPFLVLAQQPSYGTISNFEMEAGLHADGTLFMDESKSNGGFKVNSNENLVTLFSSSLWASAITFSGEILVSATTYGGQGSGLAFQPGPKVDSNFDFDKVWHVEASAINDLRDDWEDGIIDNAIDPSILEWPGRGNPNLPDLPDVDLAPFFDQNNDGIYNPNEGDYPFIGNDFIDVIPSELLYAVYSDDDQSNENVGLEFHTLMWSISCDQEDQLQKTIFNRHRIINTNENLLSLNLSLWTDPDLGCIEDDGLATIPELNAVVSYNIDPIDGDQDGNCSFNLNSFGNNPGTQSIVLLNQNASSLNGYNGIIGSVHPATTAPVVAAEYVHYMNGNWRDGTPLTQGGNGYNPGSNDVTNFIFDGNINNPNEWSMISEDLSSVDFYPLINTNYDTIGINQEFILDFAYIFSQTSFFNNLETYDVAVQDIEYVQFLYDNAFSSTCSAISSVSSAEIKEITISPNPVSSNLLIEGSYDSYVIINHLGQIVLKNDYSSILSVEHLPAGMYSILLKEKNEIRVGKFVKQ